MRETLPNCKLFISTPKLQIDHDKASLTVSILAKNIMQLKFDVADNNNVNGRYLETKGLHPNLQGISSRSFGYELFRCYKKIARRMLRDQQFLHCWVGISFNADPYSWEASFKTNRKYWNRKEFQKDMFTRNIITHKNKVVLWLSNLCNFSEK